MRNTAYLLTLSVMMFLLIPYVACAEETQTIEATGTAFFTDYMTPVDARAIALNNARRIALEKVLGKTPRADSIVYDSAAIDGLIGFASAATIRSEEILESRWEPLEGGNMGWHTSISAKIDLVEQKDQKSLNIVEVSVGRPGIDQPDTLFHPGEKIQVRLKVNKRSYLQLFGIDQNGLAFRLYPSRLTGQELIEPDDTFVFPTKHEMRFGINIRVSDLKEADKLIESILVIVSKEKGKLLSREHILQATVSDIMKELSTMSRSRWAAKATSYEVKE
jgi:hypothetical protein